MRYSYAYKLKCVELYRNGEWPETPANTDTRHFRNKIREWFIIEEAQGPEALKHKSNNKSWTTDEKYSLVAQVIAGKSIYEVSLLNGINSGLLYSWVHKYREKGYNGLVGMKKGRPSKEPQMKKKATSSVLTESEREELIRLRAEIEYIKAENEVIKKEIALREEKQAALLKAKKLRSSKNSEKKGIN